MKRIVFSLMIVFVCRFVLAQASGGSVMGVLKERISGLPLEFATVALYDMEKQQMIAGCTTDTEGRFRLTAIPAGTYYVEGSFVGYRPVRSKVLTVFAMKPVDAGTLYIEDAGEALEEVVVEGRKSTFVAKLDRKVFNVGQDLMSNAGSAGDLMQNIPSIEVDMDGVVSLRGNENVTILVNGKPSAMMSAKTRGDALNQLSANSIERIEVITNPSAEYKPDGVSGIINIVLKKDAKFGLNGTFNASLGSYGRHNAGVNLNYGMGKVNFWSGYAYRCDRYDRSIIDSRTSPADFINQTTYGVGHPVSHTFRMGLDAILSVHDVVEVAGSYNRRNFRRNERVESVTEDRNHELSDFYFRNRDALAKENMWEGSFRYTHTYGKENEWGVDYTYSSESEDEMNHYSTQRMEERAKEKEGVWDANYLHIGKLNWKHRLSTQLLFSAGYELEALRAEQNFHVLDWSNDIFVPNPDRTSDFTHYRTIHSLYTTLEADLGRWKLLAGLRGEYADIKNCLFSLDSIATQHYTNLYPTLHASRMLNGHNELQLNYSLRVNRPEGSDMNPFAERINPLSLQAGNPYLKPEKIHSVEAGWLWRNDAGTSLMTTFYYRYITNQITVVSRYIAGGVLLTTKENLQSGQSAGAELIWNASVAHWLTFNWNVNGFFNQINAEKLGYGKSKNTFAWSTLLNMNFIPFRHCMIQLNARYRSATLIPQGCRDADCRINAGVKYDIPHTRLSLLASVTDLLDTYRRSYTLDTPELKQKVVRRRNPRIFYLGASWQFGGNRNKKQDTKLEYDESL